MQMQMLSLPQRAPAPLKQHLPKQVLFCFVMQCGHGFALALLAMLPLSPPPLRKAQGRAGKG